MDQGKMINLKDVKAAIEQSSYTTTLKELEKKGRSKVKVVKGRLIYEMIAQAVNRVIEQTSSNVASEERLAMVERSREEFDRLLQVHYSETKRLRESEDDLSRARARIEELEARNARLTEENLGLRGRPEQPKSEDAQKGLLDRLVQDMGCLKSSLDDLKTAGPAQGGEMNIAISDNLNEQFSSMLDQTMGQISDRFNSKLDKMDEEKAYKQVEAAEVVLDQLFSAPEEIESNLDNVTLRQEKGGGIGDQLDLLRRAMGSSGSDDSEPSSESTN